MKGGSLYVSLSNGWFSIKFHWLIRMFLRLGTDGLYCVTKGINPLCALCCFCSSADFLFVNLTSARTLLTISSGKPRTRKCDLKLHIFSSNFVSGELVLRSLSASPLINPFFFHTWSVTGSVMRVLELFSRFKMRADVKDWILVESLAFKNTCSSV